MPLFSTSVLISPVSLFYESRLCPFFLLPRAAGAGDSWSSPRRDGEAQEAKMRAEPEQPSPTASVAEAGS